MTDRPIYLLDANVFIEAKKRYYSFGICPGFWDLLVWQHGAGRVCSIDHVKKELVGAGDDLSKWVKSAIPAEAFHSTDRSDVVGWLAQMVKWVQGEPQFNPEAKAEFAQKADAWLIAYAKTTGMVLVTHEALAPDAKKKVPMPNVCQAFAVPWIDSFQMLEDLSTRFTWEVPVQTLD